MFQYIKKRKLLVVLFIVVSFILAIYLYITSYLEAVIEGNVQKSNDNERSVTGDEVVLTYTKESGVVVSYSAQRTQTEENTLIIQSSYPRLIYTYAMRLKNPIHIKADFGIYNQKNKTVTFQNNVVLNYGELVVKAPFAQLNIDDDTLTFSQGARLEQNMIIQSKSITWNIATHGIEMTEPIIHMLAS